MSVGVDVDVDEDEGIGCWMTCVSVCVGAGCWVLGVASGVSNTLQKPASFKAYLPSPAALSVSLYSFQIST